MLDVPVSYFFDEMPSNALSGRPMLGRGRKGFGEAGTPFEREKDPMIKRETLELVRAYYKIREGRVRKRIFEMVKAVGGGEPYRGAQLPQKGAKPGELPADQRRRCPGRRALCELYTWPIVWPGRIFRTTLAFSVVVCRARSYKRWLRGSATRSRLGSPPSERRHPPRSRALGQYAVQRRSPAWA